MLLALLDFKFYVIKLNIKLFVLLCCYNSKIINANEVENVSFLKTLDVSTNF